MILRRLIICLYLVFCFAFALPAQKTTSVITFSVYAPAQAESPLHISKIEYNQSNFQMTVSNASDKPVVGVAIVGLVGTTHSCKIGSVKAMALGGSVRPLTIPPHESNVTSQHNSPFNVSAVVMSAKDFGAGGILHLQVGIVEADFADGTKWIWKPNLKREEVMGALFDASLVGADGRTCPDLETMSKALEELHGVVFDSRITTLSSTGADRTTGMPQLSFSCTLRGPRAVCPGR